MPTTSESFEVGVRQNAMEFDAHDLDRNRVLDFDEYSALVREREMGIFPEAVLRRRFEDTDTNHDGIISMKEYIVYSLRDSLKRSVARVRDLFMDWDSDNSSSIEKKEWRKAMRAMGIAALNDELDAVFAEFDTDSSGAIEFKELDRQLRAKYPMPDAGPERDIAISAQKLHELRRAPSGKVGRTLSGTGLTLDADASQTGGKSVQDQLRDAMAANLTRVIDLFRDWDDDGNGLIDLKEFRMAMRALGFRVPKAELDALFQTFDKDGGGTIDYHELNSVLRRHAQIDEKLQAGAMGKIETKAKNKHGIKGRKRRTRSKTLGDVQLSAERPLVAQLATALNAAWARVVDLFHEWDANGDGEISRRELHRAMAVLGLGPPTEAKAAERAPTPNEPARSALASPAKAAASTATKSTSFAPPPASAPAPAPPPAVEAAPPPAAAEDETTRVVDAIDALFDAIDADGQGTIDIQELEKAIRPSALKRTAAAQPGPCVPRPPFPRKSYRPVTTVLVQPPPPPRIVLPWERPASAPMARPASLLPSGRGATDAALRSGGWTPSPLTPAPTPSLLGGSSAHASSMVVLPPARPATVDPASVGRGLSVSQSMPSLAPHHRASSAPPLRLKEPPATIPPSSIPTTRPMVDAFLGRPATPTMQLGTRLALGRHPPDPRLLRTPSSIRLLKTDGAQLDWFHGWAGTYGAPRHQQHRAGPKVI